MAALTLAVGLTGCGTPDPHPARDGGAVTIPEVGVPTPRDDTSTSRSTGGGGHAASSPAGSTPSTTDGTPAADARVQSEIDGLLARWPGAAVVRGRHVEVVGSPSPTLRLVAEAGDEAWARCRRVWPEAVPGTTIVVPADAAQAAAAADDDRSVPAAGATPPADPTSGLDGAAATTVVIGEPPVARTRVHLAPAAARALSEEGMRVILTHECVHVALASAPRPAAPRWLVEGVAEHVAYRDSSVDLDDVLAPLVERTMRSGPPERFPRDRDFETVASSAHDVFLVYAEAASAAEVYARQHGDQALLRLVTRGTPSGGTDRDAYREVERDLLPRWQTALQEGQP